MTSPPSRTPMLRDADGDVVDLEEGERSGIEFYDDPEVARRYLAVRNAENGPYRTVEEPIVFDFVGELQGKSVLDVGCGTAELSKYVVEQGASRYVGVEGSSTLLRRARLPEGSADCEVIHADLESWNGALDCTFDIVVSRLVFQFLESLVTLLDSLFRLCTPGGSLVLSVEHPVLTCSFDGVSTDGIVSSWNVYDYFRRGPRRDHWLGAVVRKYHRTLEDYIAVVQGAGFRLERLSEGTPCRRSFMTDDDFERRRSVPMCAVFLFRRP